MEKNKIRKFRFLKREEYKLLLPYFVFSFIIFIFVSGFVFYNYRERVSFMEDNQNETGLRVAQEIDSFIIRASDDLKILGKNFFCLDCNEENKHLTKSLFDVNPYIYSICVFDEKGIKISSFNRYNSDPTIVSDDDLKSVLAVRKGVYISPVMISDYGLPFLLISLPVLNNNEVKIGTLVAHVDLTALWDIISRSTFRNSGYAYLVDDDAKLISYKDISFLTNRHYLNEVPVVKNFLDHNHSFSVYDSYFGQKVFGTWSYVQSTNWGLIIEFPVREFILEFLPFVIFSFFIFVAFLGFIFYIFFLIHKVEKANIKISESEKKFRSYIDEAPDGIMVIDYDGKIIEFNDALVKTTLSSSAKISKSKIYDLICEKNLDSMKNHIKRVIREGSAEDDVLYKKFSSKDDDCYYFNISSVKLSDKFILIFAKDVTKEKEVDRAKTEFVSLASHQLRTPLSAINWYSEMLLAGDGGELSENQRKFAQEIFDSNKRMVELVNSLLNVSRLEMGTFIVDPVPTNFVDLMEDVLKEQQPMIIEKKISVKKKYEKNMPLFNYDPKLLRIVFQNLVSNAAKYSPIEKNIYLEMSLDQDKKMVNIIVKDQGYGIQYNQQDKIFQKLFRADNIKKRNTEGTGLGLYIVKSIISSFNGIISFESKENKGTTFYVSLPFEGVKKREGLKSLS